MTPEERKERNRERQRRYRAKHLEELRERGRRKMREAYAADPEKFKERHRKWTADHPGYQREKATQIMREWRAKNPERANANARKSMQAWRKAHPEEAKQRDRDNPWKKSDAYRELMRQRANEYYLRNKEKVCQKAKEWIKAHPEYRRVANAARRSAELATTGSYTLADIERIYQEQDGKCAVCECQFPATGHHRYHVDHVIPLNPRKGQPRGTNDPSNLQLLCRSCNSSKGNLHPDEWEKRRKK